MKLLAIIPLLLLVGTALGQNIFDPAKIRKSISALTKQFPEYDDSSEYLQIIYDTIFKKATENELFELTNHPNPLVRRGSFYCLLDRYSTKVVNLLQKNANDTVQYFNIQYGCIIERHTFVDELLFYLSPQSGWNRNFKITSAQKEIISGMIQQREKDIQHRRQKELDEYLKNNQN